MSSEDHIKRAYKAIEFGHVHGRDPDPAFLQTYHYDGAIDIVAALEDMTWAEQVATLAKWSELNCAYATGASHPRVSAT